MTGGCLLVRGNIRSSRELDYDEVRVLAGCAEYRGAVAVGAPARRSRVEVVETDEAFGGEGEGNVDGA